VLWGGRLTYNFARKGGYKWHEEDYRWQHARKLIPAIAWPVFEITFLAT
jgi:steroid 5-alpha reductase family enzyme